MTSFIRIFSLVLLLAAGLPEAFASSIHPTPGQSARFVVPESTPGMLYIAPPNASGISVNYFDQFDVSDPLLLINAPSYDGPSGQPIRSAKTVVIVGDELSLRSSIDVVGPATDIIFIASSSGSRIDCISCSFGNALRLSLIATNNWSIDSSASEIGDFWASGAISMSNLFAPGAVALDIVGRSVESVGEIDINQAAMKDSNGGYAAVPHGRYTMGVGSIDLTSGSVRWSYEADQILQVNNDTRTVVIGGRFRAPRVSVSSSAHLRFTGTIDTRVDAIGAVSYRDETHIPQEGVVVQSLSSGGGVDASVTLAGGIYSDNTLDIRATGGITIGNEAIVKVLTASAVAGRTFKNFGRVRGQLLSIAGDQVVNEGLLEANTAIQVWAENDVANQYGGVIRAREVILDSVNKVVRNGSRTPYRTEASNRNILLDLTLSEVLSALEQDLDFQPSEINSSQLGAYYLLPGSMLLVNDGGVSMPMEHSAHIIGDNVLIRAPAFENLNPYYERVQDQAQVLLDRRRVNQVMVSAESLLEVQGPEGANENRSEYMMNSSGLIAVNSRTGKLRVQSKRLINNRFRITTHLHRYSSSSNPEPGPNDYYITKISQYDRGFLSNTDVYSPPGFLSVMGRAEINSSHYFANVMGYFEVFSGAEISSFHLKNLGMENQGVGKTTTTTESVFDRPNTYNPGRTTTVAKDPRDLDSLFYVKGSLNASDANGWFGVLNPFHYFLAEAVEFREEDIRPEINNHLYASNPTDCASSVEGCELRRFVSGSLLASIDPLEVIESVGDDEIQFNYEIDVRRTWGGYGNSYQPAQTQTVQGDHSIGLFETLAKYYETIKDKLSAVLSEFDWWGLAE